MRLRVQQKARIISKSVTPLVLLLDGQVLPLAVASPNGVLHDQDERAKQRGHAPLIATGDFGNPAQTQNAMYSGR